MNEPDRYILWLKVTKPIADDKATSQKLLDFEGVSNVQIADISNSAISKKESFLAITLSVTANFATDGIKKIVENLNENADSEVVYCRRPNGEEVVLEKATYEKHN